MQEMNDIVISSVSRYSFRLTESLESTRIPRDDAKRVRKSCRMFEVHTLVGCVRHDYS